MADTKPKAVPAKPVSSNPALVEFPRDQWGFTSDLRKAGLRAAQGVRGNPEKQELLNQTLRVIAKHAAARIEPDKAALALRLAQIKDQAPNTQRLHIEGSATPVS